MIFGEKKEFALEINEPEKGLSNLRLFVKNKVYGNFIVKGELKYAYISAKRLIVNYLDFVNPKVDDMDPSSFFNWLLAPDLVSKPASPENSQEFLDRHKHVLFLGDQMDEYSIFCSIKNETMNLFIYDVKKFKINKSEFELSKIQNVLTKFVIWYENSNPQR